MIKLIDLRFLGISSTIAAHLIETTDGPILIETGPHSTLNDLKKGLADHNYVLEDIKHVFLTHIHLDHAGAAWCFAEHGAKIYLHPFGQRHMAQPEKLMASAKRIYQDQMDRLWGQMHPIPEEQLIAVADKEKIEIGGVQVSAHHTPGHAVHHIAWECGGNLICGDVAGVKIANGPVVPPCPPPDINIEAWQKSIQMIRDLSPERLYLSHFGEVEPYDQHLNDLEEILLDWSNWMKPYFLNGTDIKTITPLFQQYVKQGLIQKGVNEEGLEQYEAANPSWMSVAGLLRYWKKQLVD